jgi:L-asparaginase II
MNPILVEVLRGSLVESRHRGIVAVCDSSGKFVFAQGDVEGRIYPRSAVKGIQALPLVESGAAERFGLGSEHLALACSSHSGEPQHVAIAEAMLAKAGRDVGTLECGVHWPSAQSASRALAASGEMPTALHNNCSGKHAGFICLACGLGVDPQHYVQPDHAAQREVTAALAGVTGVALERETPAIDGCSIPTYAIPISALARGFARFATGVGLGPERAKAARRLREAAAAHPFLVAGTGRFDTIVMELLGARAFVKTGAEGVYCAALPEQGLGIAIKCEDGTGRAAEAVMANMLLRFVPMSAEERETLLPQSAPRLRNWNGIEVGSIRVTPALN